MKPASPKANPAAPAAARVMTRKGFSCDFPRKPGREPGFAAQLPENLTLGKARYKELSSFAKNSFCKRHGEDLSE